MNVDIEVGELDCMAPKKWEQGELILKILDEVLNALLLEKGNF